MTKVVTVLGSTSCDAKRRLHAYQVHPRFRNLEVGAGLLAVEARLQLAALYAATDASTREPSGCTGGEIAMTLLRQSWGNKPLTVREVQHLDAIDAFGYRTPALSLLCNELLSSSRELSFLFREGIRGRHCSVDMSMPRLTTCSASRPDG